MDKPIQFGTAELRSAAIIDEKTEVKAYAPSRHTEKLASFMEIKSQQPLLMNRYCASEECVSKLRKAMGLSMFNGVPIYTNLRITNGEKLDVLIQYACRLWFIASYVVPSVETPFSPQQQRIVEMLANDKTIQQIAKSLKISESSVQSHLSAARVKNGFATTIAMVAWAVSKQYILV